MSRTACSFSKPKGQMSALSAAHRVLQEAGKPMGVREILKTALAKQYCDIGGKKIKSLSKNWYARYADADGIDRRASLSSDKNVAQKMLAELVKKTERASP